MIRDAGYELHHAHRESKRGGGVAILYKKQLVLKKGEESCSKYTSFEYAWILLPMQFKGKMVLVCVYRKQEISVSVFVQEFSAFVEKIVFKGDSVMFVGDFNLWVDMEDDCNAKQMLTLMNAFGHSQLVTEPTNRSGHTLDQIYVNEFQVQLDHHVIQDTLGLTTDHFPIVIEIPCRKIKQETRIIQYRNLKKVNLDAFRADLQRAYAELDDERNFEDFSSQYHTLSKAVVDKHSPVVEVKCAVTKPPWLDNEYKNSRALRRKYEKEWKKNKTEVCRTKYVNQKKVCAEMVLVKQNAHYSRIIQDAGKCQKSLFKVANEMLDKTKVKVLPAYDDPKVLANEFNEYFVEKVKKIRKSIPKSNEDESYYSRPFTGERMNQFQIVTEEQVDKIIKERGIKTSMEDPIPSKLVQPSLDILTPVFTKIINKSLQEGSMEGIKESIIDPLLKKYGLDVDENKNFRPVNNLLFLSKLTERVADDQLNTHMTSNCLHENSQFAYKQHHNTETMMLGLTEEVLKGFDNNQATVIIFLDLSAAFDTIDVDKLLEILHEEIGVGGVVLDWFRSFLENRTQRVKIENEYSDSRPVPCGAPQGSVLGPKLFNINVRSQPLVFKQSMFSTSSFADDSNGRRQFALTFQFNVLKNDIVKCMNRIVEWSNAHFMKINPDKTEILLLCPASMNNDIIIKGIIFEGQCIRFSTEVKNVGVWLDRNLNMNKHINHIVSHCFKLLKDIGGIRKCLQQDHLERLVHAVSSSRIDYCNVLFMNISKENLYKLQKTQNAAARLILGKRKRDSASAALKELHWLKVEARVMFKVLLLVFKVLKGFIPEDFDLRYKCFNGRDEDYLLLETPNFKTVYGKRLFVYNGPRLWNALPVHVRAEENIEKYKKMVKTILFDGHDSLKKKAFKYTS